MKQIDNSTIPGRLRQVRLESGLTQQDIAETLEGVTRMAVNAMETGRFLPTIETLRKYHNKFRKSYKWLIDGVEDIDKDEYEYMKIRIADLESSIRELRENNKILRQYIESLKANH